MTSYKSYDRISFRGFDPKAAGEDWAEEIIKPEPVIGIYINGTELVDILRPIEDALKEFGDECESGGYGHLSASELYRELVSAAVPETFDSYYGAHLLCCKSCGECGCWSVLAKVEASEDTVVWTLSHNHRDWDYKLRYIFSRIEYDNAVKGLKGRGNA